MIVQKSIEKAPVTVTLKLRKIEQNQSTEIQWSHAVLRLFRLTKYSLPDVLPFFTT